MRRILAALVILCPLLAPADQPRLEPLTGAPPFPADNPPTQAKIKLGQELFFETAMSGDNRRSCGTCHKPELYFTDGFSRGWGMKEIELRRKTPTVLNVGWQETMFFDSRVKTLEEQVAKPLENDNEMGIDPAEAARKIASSKYYQRLFKEVFPGEEITFELISKAVASYERTLVSYDSDLDRYLLGDDSALTPEAKRGMELFSGKAGCIACHHGPMLTDHQRHYTGVAENEGDSKPGTKYKTQSLRDVMRRYSFMHNGEMLKIDDVLDHYVRGGSAPEGLKAEIEPLELTAEERLDLTAFLRSLNGRVAGLLDAEQLAQTNPAPKGPPLTGGDEAAAANPAYLKPQQPAAAEGPVQDPNYTRRR